jgi:thiol-disulfide isomerase/thioredoxin
MKRKMKHLLGALLMVVTPSLLTEAVGQEEYDPSRDAPGKAPFAEFFGRMRSGMAPANFAVETAEGKKARLYDFARGQATVLVFWNAGKGPGRGMLQYLDQVARSYQDQGLTVLGVGCLEAREKFDEWLKANRERCSFPIVFDPAGKGPRLTKTREEIQAMPVSEQMAIAERWTAYVTNTIVGRLLDAGGATPQMPVFLVLDSEARFVGALWPGSDRQEAMGNLLLRAGIKLAEEDKPKRVYTREETKLPEPEPAVKAIPVGSVAPDFAALDAGGKEVSLSDYRGKVVVLDFWATWCGPCIKALPHAQKIAAQYGKQGVVVLAVCTQDKRSSFENWLKKNRQNFPDIVFLHDPAESKPERVSRQRYGVTAIPRQFVIDRAGKIVDTVEGYMEGEVIVDAALAKAGIDVDQAILTKAKEDLIQRSKR